MHPEWGISFQDVFSQQPASVSVRLANKVMCVSGLVIEKLALTGQSWGVQVDYAVANGPFQSVGFGWDGHRELLQQLGLMVSVTSVRHNVWAEFLPHTALYVKTVTVLEGGRLCLGTKLIEKLVFARYGNDAHGWEDVAQVIERAVVSGGVKGLVISDATMGANSGSIDGGDVDAGGKKLLIAFLSTACPKPPPKTAGQRRGSSASGQVSAGSRSSEGAPPAMHSQGHSHSHSSLGVNSSGSRGSLGSAPTPMQQPLPNPHSRTPYPPRTPSHNHSLGSDGCSSGSGMCSPAPQVYAINNVGSPPCYAVHKPAPFSPPPVFASPVPPPQPVNPALTGNTDVYIAYVQVTPQRTGLYLAYDYFAPGTKVVVTAQSNSTTIGAVTQISKVTDMQSCGDIVESVIGRA